MPLAVVRVKPRLPRAYLSFDGVDDYVKVSHSESLNVTKLTLEAWVKARSMAAYGVIVGKPVYYSWGIYSERDEVNRIVSYNVYVGGTRYECRSSTANLIDGEWHHVAMTYDGETLKAYFDGELVASRTDPSGPLDTNTDPVFVGARSGVGNYFNGVIDEVCIYNRALSAEEIRHNYYRWGSPVKDGLVLWLAEDTINPPTWNDKSGYGNDGTIYGATKVERPYSAVRVNSAARVLAAVR